MARFLLGWTDDPAAHADVIATKQKLGRKAIGAIERRGAAHDFLVADRYSVADICLYGYTHMAGQAGIDLAGFPAVAAWVARVAAQPEHVLITD